MTSNILRDISETRDLGIPMPNGKRLSARTWIPTDADGAPYTAILEFLPYHNRDGTMARDCLTHPYLAKRGGITLRTEASSEMHSDKTHFYLTTRLEAFENNILVYEKDVKRSVTRDNL